MIAARLRKDHEAPSKEVIRDAEEAVRHAMLNGTLSGTQIRPEDRLAIWDVVNAFRPWGVPDTARAPRTAAG